jgi:hypothetical protein
MDGCVLREFTDPMTWSGTPDIAQRVSINYRHSAAGYEQKLLLISSKFCQEKRKKS